MDAWIAAIASVILVSLLSMIGIVLLMVSDKVLKSVVFVLVGLAVGGLFGDAFVHLIPEAFDITTSATLTSVSILLGVFAFFILEKFLHWRHEHTCEFDEICIKPVGYINLASDGVHNLIDGLLIGVSYLASIEIGVATTLAIIMHEIPQEIGDFGVLIHAGFTKRRALFFNFLAASVAIAGTITSLMIGETVESYKVIMLPLAAGGFIYIAGSDLVPEMQRESSVKKSTIQILAIAAGVGLILILKLFE
ncbi:MAG: ZIP family metal transporter [Methanomassiliicoccales archaeon]|nr:ZIP family metal transporter [Methanomassiliicoccales archaeon]